MSTNVFTTLRERGFIYQTTDETALEQILAANTITCYVGFDATADSLHVGSLVPIMALMHMQRAGHRPIALLGGGTTMVGDPSGKTEMRQMLTVEQIRQYGERIRSQFATYLSFDNDKALLLNNAEWLIPLNYIEFLRDIGRHFSVNRMLAAESYKQRLESGLSFIEFNYMLLQSYDFYVLARDYDCLLQMGGQDQWGNIVAGSDLTRRMMGKQVYGMTFPLLMTASGEKFGKSAGNAVWLDRNLTLPYDFYQYWRNIDDADVEKCLGLFTFLPMEEVKRLPGENINRAKEILAFEATAITHGFETAAAAYTAAAGQFGLTDPEGKVKTVSRITDVPVNVESTVPTVTLAGKDLSGGVWIVSLFVEAGLCASNGEVRRLIKQGGAYLNGEKIVSDTLNISEADLDAGAVLLQAGKKRHKRIVFA
ncbi:tyrosine--tRNA ligase [bacterium]|nr:tyrosine--tRNA ligase [bacterium]